LIPRSLLRSFIGKPNSIGFPSASSREKRLSQLPVVFWSFLWHVLSKRQSYRHLTDTQIASKMMRWSWKLRKHHPKAVASRVFIRRRLMTLGVGKNLSSFQYNNLPRGLASDEEAFSPSPE
jgi:hypothetical protein